MLSSVLPIVPVGREVDSRTAATAEAGIAEAAEVDRVVPVEVGIAEAVEAAEVDRVAPAVAGIAGDKY